MRLFACSLIVGSVVTTAAYAEVEEIVVTAQRRAESLRDVPLTVNALTAEDLARSNITDTRQLQTVVPGLTFAQYGALAEPAIRGVHTTSGTAGNESPNAVYLDGFYQPSQIGGIFELPDTRQIEVLKGPQGTLFGRNATGGAILIHTLDPSLTEFSGSITVSDGVYVGENVNTSNDFNIKGFINIPVTDKLAISVAGNWRNTSGYMTDDVTGDDYGYVASYLTRMKVLYQPTDNVRFILTGMYSEITDEAGASYIPLNGVTAAAHPLWTDAIIPTQPWHTAGEVGGSHVDVISQAISLTSEFTFPGAGQLTSRTGFSYIDSPQVITVDGAYSPLCYAAGGCPNYGYDPGPQRTYQQELVFTSETFGMFSFTAGANYYFDRHQQTQNVTSPVFLSSDPRRDVDLYGGIFSAKKKVETEAKAIFAEGYLDATDKLRLIAGIRYSHEVKEGRVLDASGLFSPGIVPIPGGRWQAWTPRFSVIYKFTPTINGYATYSKGFKSGSVNADSAVDPANPERLTSYEVGVKIGTSDYSLNLSGFYYDYKNLIIQTFNGVSTTDYNAAAVEIYGLDFDGTAQITPEFRLRVSGSWIPQAEYLSFPVGVDYQFPLGPFGLNLVTVDATGDRVLKTPRFTGSIVPSYEKETSIGTVDASVTVYYSSSYKANLLGRVVTPSYVTIATDIGLTLPGDRVRISVWGKNLTNEDYHVGALLSGTADTVVFAPPREIGVAAKYSF